MANFTVENVVYFAWWTVTQKACYNAEFAFWGEFRHCREMESNKDGGKNGGARWESMSLALVPILSGDKMMN